MNLLSQNEADTLLDVGRQVNNGWHDVTIYESLRLQGFIAKTLSGRWACTDVGHTHLLTLSGAFEA